jgi:uncharacterized protein YcfJ
MSEMGLNNRISSVRPIARDVRIDESRYGPEPLSARDGRDYRRRNGERIYEADVTSVRAVVATATQRCWVEPAPEQRSKNVPGAIVGAVIGGILGHQVGHGTGQDIATIGGAAGGAYIGSKVGTSSAPQNVQRCENVQSQTPTYYDVTYNFRGLEHRVQMTTAPGPTVRVNEKGEPRA